jgi:hypothetical protein
LELSLATASEAVCSPVDRLATARSDVNLRG